MQNPGSSTQTSGVSLQSRVIELEAEVQQLKDQLGKAKSINDTMWDTVVRKVIIDGNVKGKEDGGDSGMEVDEH